MTKHFWLVDGKVLDQLSAKDPGVVAACWHVEMNVDPEYSIMSFFLLLHVLATSILRVNCHLHEKLSTK